MDHSLKMGFDAGDEIIKHPDNISVIWYTNLKKYKSFRIID